MLLCGLPNVLCKDTEIAEHVICSKVLRKTTQINMPLIKYNIHIWVQKHQNFGWEQFWLLICSKTLRKTTQIN